MKTAEEWLKNKLDSQEYTYDLRDSNRKAYPLELWVKWMQEYSDQQAQERFQEAYEFLDLDVTAKLVKGHTIFETTFNNMVKALQKAAGIDNHKIER